MRCSTKGSDKISFIPALPSFIPYKAYFPYQYNTGVFASNGLGYPFGYPNPRSAASGSSLCLLGSTPNPR